MRIAHFSDIHLLALDGVGATRFINKRFTGWVNLKVKRGHKHRVSHARAVMREIARANVDHAILTGDLTNLALEGEFAAVRALLEAELGLARDQISVVPGNHDLYTHGSLRARRFSAFFAPYVKSDLPELAAAIPLGLFPFVKLRGPVAIIGLSSAVPRPPFIASGELGREQIEALVRILAHDEVKKRSIIVALHHPAHNPPSKMKTLAEGLWDASALASALAHLDKGIILHGHLHVRQQKPLATHAGELIVLGATSASLHDDENEHKMAGFNVYEFDTDGELTSVQAHVYEPQTDSFRTAPIPVIG
ncbi:MAG: metallophosphoesterase [Polyangiaceae bacterium]|nr:metallophosphoesterase [Polyangiaceae bacterium]